MFTAEITPIPNSIQQSLKIRFHIWGTENEEKEFSYTVNQRKNAYEIFVVQAAEYLRWTSDYLYSQLQGIHKYYFDLTSVPYFGHAQKNWASVYWNFIDSRDRARLFPTSEKELAKSYKGKIFGELIPIYHFPERLEIKKAIATIEKLSVEILATISKLQKETFIPALAD